MNGRNVFPPGRAIVAVAPRHDALATIGERVRDRRHRKRRNTAVAGLVAVVAVVAPLLLRADPFTTGLEPTRPGETPSVAPGPDGRNDYAPSGYGSAIPAGASPASGASTASDPSVPSAAPPGAWPSAVPGGSGTLTLTGSTAGYGMVHVDHPTTVDLAAASFTWVGEYAGIVVGDVEVLYIRGMEDGVRPTFRGATSVTLPPGDHRVYVLTRAGTPLTVTLPWSAPSMTVQPAVTIDVDYERTQPMLAEDRSASGHVVFDTTPASVTIVSANFDPAPSGVTLTGCFIEGWPRTCAHSVTAASDGTTVRLRDRMTGEHYARSSYTVEVHRGPYPESPGLLRFVIFTYDRD